MSTYGDMLNFFPELQRAFDTYTMSPKNVAGFNASANKLVVYGIIQQMKAGGLPVEGDTMSNAEVPTLWTRNEIPKGSFIIVDGIHYRLTKDNRWTRDGAFSVYVLESINGVTNTQETDTDVTLGIGFYG